MAAVPTLSLGAWSRPELSTLISKKRAYKSVPVPSLPTALDTDKRKQSSIKTTTALKLLPWGTITSLYVNVSKTSGIHNEIPQNVSLKFIADDVELGKRSNVYFPRCRTLGWSASSTLIISLKIWEKELKKRHYSIVTSKSRIVCWYANTLLPYCDNKRVNKNFLLIGAQARTHKVEKRARLKVNNFKDETTTTRHSATKVLVFAGFQGLSSA